MLPVSFNGQNKVYTKPKGWKDEECSDLPVFEGLDQTGRSICVSAWKPSKEDLEAMNKGLPVFLCVHANIQMPVELYTLNENGEYNG